MIDACNKENRLAWARKYEYWSSDDKKKVIFSDKTHFLVHGYRAVVVRKSIGEPVRAKHLQQTVKYSPKNFLASIYV